MLRICATHTCRVLWTKSDMTSAFIDEVIHLFCHNISCIAESLEDSKLFEHGRHDALKSCGFNNGGEDGRKFTPPSSLRGQDVAGTRGGLERRHDLTG